MGLKFLEARDLATFIQAVISDQGTVDFAPTLPGGGTGSGNPISTYMDQLDKLIIPAVVSGPTPTRFGMNPLLVGTGFPDAFLSTFSGFPRELPLIVGDPLRPGGQKLYASAGGIVNTAEWEEVTPVTSLINTGVGAFPTVPAGNGPIRVILGIGTAIPPGPGTWNAGNTAPDGFGFFAMVFEGLTDGISGETNLVGTNVYPKGLMLLRARVATCPAPIGTGGANDCDRALVWLDLNTGLVDGRIALTPGAADSSGVNTEAPIAGQEFNWHVTQYMPDTDATFAAPKGELLLSSDAEGVPADPANFPESIFVKIIDFNPFGVIASGGAPTRDHERIRLQSSLDFNDDPMFDVSTAGAASFPGRWTCHFHPPSRRFFIHLAVDEAAAAIPAAADDGFLGYWARAVDVSILTTPVARDVPRTNDVVDFESFTTGSLGEPASGATVDWELFRNSSELEVLDASTFPGTSTVANAPIDDTFPTAPEGSLVVISDTVTLVEGVDYTVVLSTGVITWITDQSGAALVTATYEHRETNVSPAHGTLLTTTSQSDLDGRVLTQVRYEDNDALVGTLDRLIGTLA